MVRHPQARARWVADGVVDAIADLSTRELPPVPGRVKPLIGLPLVWTGAGGCESTRGVLIHELLPALTGVARECDVDIALVLIDQRDHAAVQAVRRDFWTEFVEEQPEIARDLEIADEFGGRAARGELSPFLGSGVSVPLGVPDWKTILSTISPNYLDLFAGDGPTTQLRERLLQLANELETDTAISNGTPGWAQLKAFLSQLGRRAPKR